MGPFTDVLLAPQADFADKTLHKILTGMRSILLYAFSGCACRATESQLATDSLYDGAATKTFQPSRAPSHRHNKLFGSDLKELHNLAIQARQAFCLTMARFAQASLKYRPGNGKGLNTFFHSLLECSICELHKQLLLVKACLSLVPQQRYMIMQMMNVDDILDCSGDVIRSLPFSIASKLCRPVIGKQGRHVSNPLLYITEDEDPSRYRIF